MATSYRGNSSRKNALRRIVKRRDPVCWLCSKPIDWSLTYKRADGSLEPMYGTLDHVVPQSVSTAKGTLDPTNVRGAHFRCNQQRGTAEFGRVPSEGATNPSEDW